MIVSSRFPNYQAKYRASIYAEMVQNLQTEFTLTLDTEMLSWFQHKHAIKLPFNTQDELWQICQKFTHADELLLNVANLLVQYAQFAGTGMKTRLGMGQTDLVTQNCKNIS